MSIGRIQVPAGNARESSTLIQLGGKRGEVDSVHTRWQMGLYTFWCRNFPTISRFPHYDHLRSELGYSDHFREQVFGP